MNRGIIVSRTRTVGLVLGLVLIGGVVAAASMGTVWWRTKVKNYPAPGGMLFLQNTADGTAIHSESTGGLAMEAVGGVDVQVPDGTPPVTVSSTTTCTNLSADLLDGKNSTDFLRAASNNIGSGGGTTVISFPHHRMCQLSIAEVHASPQEVAVLFFAENDHQIAYTGWDGAGNMVHGTAYLGSVSTILTLKGGNITLETPGALSYELVLNSLAGETVKSWISWDRD